MTIYPNYFIKYNHYKPNKFNLIILISNLLLVLYIYNRNNSPKNRICICTLGKEENRYIREWVQHYEKYGVDKIYLYDNNDINGEHFESVINDYINKEFVQILNWRGKTKIVYDVMNECYNLHRDDYDWLLFYELDEFIHLTNFNNIKQFLNEKKFDKCQIIYLNLIVHNDNNKLFYENSSLFERFPNIVPATITKELQVKMIIKGGIKNLKIISTAKSSLVDNKTTLRTCNGFGNFMTPYHFHTNITDYKLYYVDHFFCKSTEEFINKLARGDILVTGKALENYKLQRIKRFFKYNNITFEKVTMIEKVLNINLNNIKKKIKE